MRALIIDSVSRETVISPCSTWLTNSLTRLLPRSRAAGILAQPALLDDLIEQAHARLLLGGLSGHC